MNKLKQEPEISCIICGKTNPDEGLYCIQGSIGFFCENCLMHDKRIKRSMKEANVREIEKIKNEIKYLKETGKDRL